MSSLKEISIALLGSVSGVDMEAGAGPTVLLTVPADKVARITHVVIRDISATLVGGSDYDFTNWVQDVDLSGITTATTTKYFIVTGDNTQWVELGEGVDFQITNSTGSSGAATATIDVFGYLT